MEVFRRAVDAVVHAKLLSGTNERTEQKEIDGRAILSSSDELLSPTAERIVSTIRECLARISKAHGRDEAFQAFHRAKFTAVADLWRELYGIIEIEYSDQLLSQSVNQKIFDDAVINYSTSQTPVGASPRTPELTKAEMNILRLAAGSVPFSLLKRCRRLPDGERKRAVLACVESMRGGSSTGDDITTPTDSDSSPSAAAESWSADDSSLSWISLIDRGGLFRINEATFQFLSYWREKWQYLYNIIFKQHILTKNNSVNYSQRTKK